MRLTSRRPRCRAPRSHRLDRPDLITPREVLGNSARHGFEPSLEPETRTAPSPSPVRRRASFGHERSLPSSALAVLVQSWSVLGASAEAPSTGRAVLGGGVWLATVAPCDTTTSPKRSRGNASEWLMSVVDGGLERSPSDYRFHAKGVAVLRMSRRTSTVVPFVLSRGRGVGCVDAVVALVRPA